MIQMISITEFYPHKDNPHKDLGDLSELTEPTSAEYLQKRTGGFKWLNN